MTFKNTGNIAVWLNHLSRVVFKNKDTSKVYANRLAEWKTTDEEKGGEIDPKHDTIAIYPGDSLILEFKEPIEAPESGGEKAPPGTYDVYFYLHGYDEFGNLYAQTIYYGTLTFD